MSNPALFVPVGHCFSHLTVAFVGAVLLRGCNLSDEAEELSGGYLYRNEGTTTKELLGETFVLGRRGMESIHGEVVRYRYNEQFIVAVQRPVYKEYLNGVAFDLRDDLQKYQTNSEAERLASERVADSLLTYNPHYKSIFVHETNYWIIAHRLHQVFGPLTYQEYARQAQALHLPAALALKAE